MGVEAPPTTEIGKNSQTKGKIHGKKEKMGKIAEKTEKLKKLEEN